METNGVSNLISFRPPAIPNSTISSFVRTIHAQKARTRAGTSLFRSVWENSRDGMRITDEDGIVVAVNKAYCRLVGSTPAELIGTAFSEIYHPSQDPEKILQTYKRRFRDNDVMPRYERRLTLLSGKTLEVEVISTFVQADEGGMYVLTEFRDIADRKQVERALSESESKYRGMFANSVQPMFVSSVEGKLVNANIAMMKLLGYSSFLELAELDIARDIYVNAMDRVRVKRMLETQGYLSNAEIKLKRKDGQTIDVIEYARTLRDDRGNIVGYEGTLEDFTARKAMEESLREHVEALEESRKKLAELNAQKDKFVSILSHDLRSPFASILGFCELLLTEKDQLKEEERDQFLGFIKEAAQDQLGLVNKLLDWSRLESGRIRMDTVELDLACIIEKSIRSLSGLASQKMIAMSSTVPSGLLVRGDEQLLQQLFHNLLGNAIKFTRMNGSVVVEASGEKEQGQLKVAVKDDGIGIPQADLGKLFKIEEKYTRPGLQGEKGTGLGLSLCHEIIQKHGGNITVESELGKGTTFTLSFPDARPAGTSVLIVDDEEGVRTLHARYLRRLMPHANILFATHGQEAVDVAKKVRPKVILSDYYMPLMNGSELVTALRADDETKTIPLIIITGHDSKASKGELIQKGVVKILAKPVTPEILSEALKDLRLIDSVNQDSKEAVSKKAESGSS